MSNAMHSYDRSQAPKRFPLGSLDEAIRVIDEARATNPILAARAKHIDMVLSGLARLRPGRSL
jgi:hypothetical protein